MYCLVCLLFSIEQNKLTFGFKVKCILFFVLVGEWPIIQYLILFIPIDFLNSPISILLINNFSSPLFLSFKATVKCLKVFDRPYLIYSLFWIFLKFSIILKFHFILVYIQYFLLKPYVSVISFVGYLLSLLNSQNFLLSLIFLNLINMSGVRVKIFIWLFNFEKFSLFLDIRLCFLAIVKVAVHISQLFCLSYLESFSTSDFLQLNLSYLSYLLVILVTAFIIIILFQISWSCLILLLSSLFSKYIYSIEILSLIILLRVISISFILYSSVQVFQPQSLGIMISIEGGMKIRLWFVTILWNLRRRGWDEPKESFSHFGFKVCSQFWAIFWLLWEEAVS